jgi:predicted flap endonuclease-1-like 5' DNA nuclease
MTERDILILVGVVAVALLLLLIMVRGRRQRVTFSDAVPPPPAVTRDAPVAPAATPVPATDDVSAGQGLGPSGDATPAITTDGDPLTRIKGLGPKAAAQLATLGVTRFAQIAAWSDADASAVDARMGVFQGRIARDRWIEQARLLAADDTATFEERFGKLGG